MAIRDTSRKPFIEDNDSKVKIGIDLPIRRGDDLDGFFATTSTTIEAVKNNIRNLLQTNEGERFFQPDLGVNLKTLLFENVNDENLLQIQNNILDKLEIYLPFVEVRNIEVLNQSNDVSINVNEIRVKVIFNIKQDPNTLESVQVDFSNETSQIESTNTSTSGY